MKAADVRAALELRHPETEAEWVVLHEWNGIDTLAVRCYMGKIGPVRIAYEVKVSLSDFRRELARPEKRRYAVDVSHFYVFAMPWLLAQQVKHQVPAGLGLVGVLPGDELRTRLVLKPRRSVPRPLTDGEVSGLVRHRAQPPALRHALMERFQRNEEIGKLRDRVRDLEGLVAELALDKVTAGCVLRPAWSQTGYVIVEGPVRRRGKTIVVGAASGLEEPRELDLGMLLGLGYRPYPAESQLKEGV